MKRLVSKKRIKEARAQELRQELLNSERLKAHFEDNPQDLNLLRHDSALRPIEVQPHLAVVPDYLIPPALRKGTGARAAPDGAGGPRKGGARRTADPLQTFALTKDVLASSARAAPRGIHNMMREVGASASGRRRWKQRHGKGEFRKGGSRKRARK